MANAVRDNNYVPTILGVSSVDGVTPIPIKVNPVTHAIKVEGAGGVSGPESSTDNAIVRWSGTGGDTLQDSSILIDDSDNITGVTSITVGNTGLTVGSSVPFSDSSGTLTLQNIDALDATTISTIENSISAGLSWGDSVTSSDNETSEGLTLTLSNTQDNAEEILVLNTGTSAQGHKALQITAAGASTSQYGAYIDMSTTGTGTGLYVTRTYSSDDQDGVLAKFVAVGNYNMAENDYRWIYDDADYGELKLGTNNDYYVAGSSSNDQPWLALFDTGNRASTSTMSVGVQGSDTRFVINNDTATNHFGLNVYTGRNLQNQDGSASISRRIYATGTGTTAGSNVLQIREINNTDGSSNHTSTAKCFDVYRLTSRGASATWNHSGDLVTIRNVITGSGGTLNDTAVLLNIQQDDEATGYPISVTQAAVTDTNFKKIASWAGVTLWVSDGTTPNGNLTGTAGDVCYNGASSQPFYCTGTTNWTGM